MILYMTINLLKDNFAAEVIVPYSYPEMLLMVLAITDFSETINARFYVMKATTTGCVVHKFPTNLSVY